MSRSKMTISWDELQSQQVDERLARQDAALREATAAAEAAKGDPTAPAGAAAAKRRLAWWYNSIVFMSVFGLLGGLLGWAGGEIFHFGRDVKAEARDLLAAQKEIATARASFRLSEEEAIASDRQLRIAGAKNPYFTIMNDPSLNDRQRVIALRDLERRDAWKDFFANVLFYSVCGMMIAASLSAAESIVVRNWSAALTSGATGAALGLIGGVIVSLFVDLLYGWLAGSLDAQISVTRELIARSISWGVLGLFLMIAPGLLMRNLKSMLIGLAGGLLGGLVGGLLLVLVKRATESDHIGQLVAITTIGLLAGLISGIIESAAKTGWLKVTAGWIAGKQFVLYRNPTYIGSSLQCSVYLFKDPQVGRRHAAVHIVPGGFEIEDLPLGGPTMVNGKRVTRARLRAGDRIQIGMTSFLFQEKTVAK